MLSKDRGWPFRWHVMANQTSEVSGEASCEAHQMHQQMDTQQGLSIRDPKYVLYTSTQHVPHIAIACQPVTRCLAMQLCAGINSVLIPLSLCA